MQHEALPNLCKGDNRDNRDNCDYTLSMMVSHISRIRVGHPKPPVGTEILVVKEKLLKSIIPALKEDLNVAVVFQHLAENYVNKVEQILVNIWMIMIRYIISAQHHRLPITISCLGQKHGLHRLRLPQPFHRESIP